MSLACLTCPTRGTPRRALFAAKGVRGRVSSANTKAATLSCTWAVSSPRGFSNTNTCSTKRRGLSMAFVSSMTWRSSSGKSSLSWRDCRVFPCNRSPRPPLSSSCRTRFPPPRTSCPLRPCQLYRHPSLFRLCLHPHPCRWPHQHPYQCPHLSPPSHFYSSE